MWERDTVIMLERKRYKCSYDPERPFDERFEFLKSYQCQTIPFEKYAVILVYKNTIQNATNILDSSEHMCQRIYKYHAGTVLESRELELIKLLGSDDIIHKKWP